MPAIAERAVRESFAASVNLQLRRAGLRSRAHLCTASRNGVIMFLTEEGAADPVPVLAAVVVDGVRPDYAPELGLVSWEVPPR